jgi:hypothetical protein
MLEMLCRMQFFVYSVALILSIRMYILHPLERILKFLVSFVSSFLISLFGSLLVCPSLLCPDKLASIMAKSSNYSWFMTKLVYIASHRVLTHCRDTGDIMVLVTSIHFIVEIH